MNEQWTSVEKETPQNLACRYIVSAIDNYGFRREFVAYITTRHDGFQAMDIKDQPLCKNVTHWMPMPYYDTTTLRRESDREKSERYICTHCGGICYFPYGKHRKIWYHYCPCCGLEVQYETKP